jgi:hypothetical protein
MIEDASDSKNFTITFDKYAVAIAAYYGTRDGSLFVTATGDAHFSLNNRDCIVRGNGLFASAVLVIEEPIVIRCDGYTATITREGVQ